MKKITQRYTIVDNDIINDKRLSFAARGLLIYFIANPNTYQIAKEVARTAPGDDIAKSMAEIKEAGYEIEGNELIKHELQ